LIDLLKSVINWLSNPTIFVSLSIVLFCLSLYYRAFWSRTALWIATGLTAAFLLFSITDENFWAIIAKPDNVPITLLLVLVGFFTWLSLHQAFENDRRTAAGEPILERQEPLAKTFVWPDLVYIELIALIVCTFGLILWSVVLKAPIEEPANPTDSPPSAKAPWYFLGLQEMLVYFDPWIAGVVLPTLIIVGLMAIPYIDRDPKGSGYFTFKERKLQIIVYLFGWLILWVLLIILGTFLRGPNWNFFGPYEYWDVHKLVLLNNINLSEFIWVRSLGVRLPSNWLLREFFGIALVVGYFVVPPLVLAKTWFRRYLEKLGPVRYHLMVFLLLGMLSLPIKMYLRWMFNMKYIVAIPEFFFNI
jgi:hypothetical protein